MSSFKITLKNYRCFEDSNPLTIDLGPRFIALVGPNNSGKSTFLKFFYEARVLLNTIFDYAVLARLAQGGTIGMSYEGIEDSLELFHNRNLRPLTVEFEFPQVRDSQITFIRLTCRRAEPNNWQGEIFCEQPRLKLVGPAVVDGKQAFDTAGGGPMVGDLTPLTEASQLATNSMYIGPFRNAITEGSGRHYDLAIGTSFIQLWDEWKTGGSRKQNEVAQTVIDEIARIFGYNSLQVNAAVPGHTVLQAIINGKPFRLRELGAGLAQFLIVLANVAIKRPAWLLIDEPESNLHPSLQSDFLTSLGSYTTQGVMFATHSIGLARTVGDRVYAFQKPEYSAIARPFEQTPNFAEFVGEMSFSSFKELGHESILLVEGVTEVKAIQQFLRKFGKDHKVVVIPLGGGQLIRGGVQPELAELKRLSNCVAVLIDSERPAQRAPLDPQRQAFADDCRVLGFEVLVTERRAFENYLTERAVQHVKGPTYHALGHYDVLSSLNPSWGKHENWRIAREMTEAELTATDVGDFLQRLP